MKITNKIFTALLFALTTMPVYAIHNDDITIQLLDRFCKNNAGGGMNCNAQSVFTCDKYKDDFGPRDQILLNNINRLYKRACEDTTNELLSNSLRLKILGQNVIGVYCKSGYKHPDTGSDQEYKCVNDPNYQQAVDNCKAKGAQCELRRIEQHLVTSYECECPDLAQQQTNVTNQATAGQQSAYSQEAQAILAGQSQSEDEDHATYQGQVVEANYVDPNTMLTTDTTAQMVNTPKLEVGSVGPAVYNEDATQHGAAAVSSTVAATLVSSETLQKTERQQQIEQNLHKEVTVNTTTQGSAKTQAELSESDKAAIEQERKFQRSGMVKDETATTKKPKPTASKETTVVEKIKKSAQTVGAGDSISFDRDVSGADVVREEMEKWRAACKANVEKMEGVKEAGTTAAGSSEKTLTTKCQIIKCDEQSEYTLSNNGKSCVKTKEQKKAESEYKVQDDGSKSVIESIKSASNNVKIGDSVTIPTNLKDNDKVDTEFSIWEQKCTNIKKDPVSNTDISTDIEEKSGKYTCIIQTCKTQGYKRSNNKLSCEMTKEYEQGTFENGDECTPTDKHSPKGTYNSETKTCIPTECADKFELVDGECISENKKERLDKKEEKTATKSFKNDVKKLHDAFDKLVARKTGECASGVIEKGICKAAEAE